MKFLRKLADPNRRGSLTTKTRQKNFEIFKSLISTLPRPLKILDVGGTQGYWEEVGFAQKDGVEITLLNISQDKVTHPFFRSIAGDARDLSEFHWSSVKDCDRLYPYRFINKF